MTPAVIDKDRFTEILREEGVPDWFIEGMWRNKPRHLTVLDEAKLRATATLWNGLMRGRPMG